MKNNSGSQDKYSGNNLKLARHFLRLKHPVETMAAVSALVKPHINDGGNVAEELQISIGELDTFLYQSRRY